jgi:SAM-dependent methyltransferase
MITLNRLSGVLTYLKRADPIYRWAIDSGRCPLCGPSLFLAMAGGPFLVRCLKCRANVTNLAIAEAVRQNVPNLGFQHAYEMSTYGSSFEFLKKHCSIVESSEYFPDSSPGEMVNGIRNEDAQQLSFHDCSFDLVTSNQVFEHVPNIERCLAECKRVLKPGGRLFFTVPLYETNATEHVAEIDHGAIRWLSTPEYHSSRTTGPNSVPVFWRFSVHDIVERVSAAQFSHVTLLPISIYKHQHEPQLVVYATK